MQVYLTWAEKIVIILKIMDFLIKGCEIFLGQLSHFLFLNIAHVPLFFVYNILKMKHKLWNHKFPMNLKSFFLVLFCGLPDLVYNCTTDSLFLGVQLKMSVLSVNSPNASSEIIAWFW